MDGGLFGVQKGVSALKVAWLPQDGVTGYLAHKKTPNHLQDRTVYEDCDLSDDSISEPNRICPAILGCAQLQRRVDMLVEAHRPGSIWTDSVSF